jgi:hypothetical protein
MFGKEPELYYKSRPKKTSWIGRILSFLFVLVYFAFFLYKLIRMLKKVDVTFYDTFTYADKPPAVPLTHNNFYIAFALEDPITYNPFVDESVYYPKAYFKRAEMKGDDFEWKIVELEVERCKLEKFGESYREVFKNVDLYNHYCFKDINNYILEGHFSYLLYSFFYIEFYPCVNTTESKKCKPLNEIDYYLKNTFVSFEIENIELTPKNYENPTRPRNTDVYTTVGKKLFQELHVYFEVVNIETDLDWFGFDEFENIKSDIYLKYDEMFIMGNLIEEDIYETGNKFCDVTFKLSENVRTQRRVYTKFVTILGDVGGLMEVIFTFFRLISSFSVDILYEISLVNRLFKFDLDKKNVILRENDQNNFKQIKVFNINDKETIKEKKIENNDITIIANNTKKNMKNKSNKLFSKKKVINRNINNEIFSMNFSNTKSKSNFQDVEIGNKIAVNDDKKNNMNNESKNIVNKVRLNRACIYFWFCFARHRKIQDNFLITEGMDLISKRLDIFNIFEKIYQQEQRKETVINKVIPMSDECKAGLNIFL